MSPQSRHVIRRTYNKFNYDKFISDIIHSELLSLVSYTTDLNEAWSIFKAEFLDISNSNAHLQKFTVKPKSNPWISTEILKLIYTRDHLHKVAISLNSEIAWADYRSFRNKVTATIRKAKSSFYTSKDFGDLQLPNLELSQPINNFSFLQISVDFVLHELLHLSLKPKLDLFNFDNRLLRLSAPLFSPILTHIFNLSLFHGTLPDDWKTARITPIFKGKGSHSDPGNFRPISIVSTIAKIIEKNVKSQ